jgi:hypothetical protein
MTRKIFDCACNEAVRQVLIQHRLDVTQDNRIPTLPRVCVCVCVYYIVDYVRVFYIVD